MKTFDQFLAGFLINDFTGLLYKYNLSFENNPIKPRQMGFIVSAIYAGILTRYSGKEIIARILEKENESPLRSS